MNDLILSFSLESSPPCPVGTWSYLPVPCCIDSGWYLTGQIKETGRTKLGAEVIQPFNFSKEALLWVTTGAGLLSRAQEGQAFQPWSLPICTFARTQM